ncbi:TonB-dependent receptor [Colwellia sp. MSW7]|uniref:TonB-dependent receptor n=1 Tax=Colwellia maritima TaxID=2912588 RepID=A0ABS9X1M2_9GAMM|nr:TonB-dependent receptor [Colwellia maritima]MCI2284080.1 TonB-dependent receptor [Colwellia maritima]
MLSISQGTGFKAPTFNDLYWPGSGNPALKPENVESKEILLRNSFSNGSVEISVYDADIDNLINWAPDAEGNWSPANIDKASAKGVDLTVALQSGDFSHLLAAGYVKTEDESTGNELLRRPKVKATYTLGYQIEALTTSITLDYRGKSEDNKYVPITLDAALLTNVSVNYQFSDKFSVIAKLNNLFDKDYDVAEHYYTDGVNYQWLQLTLFSLLTDLFALFTL